MVMPAHVLFTLLLILRGLTRDSFAVEVLLMRGHGFIRVVRPQLEVMPPQLFQFVIVQFSNLSVIPSLEQYFIGGGKIILPLITQTIPPKRIRNLHLILLPLLAQVILMVNRLVILRSSAQLEMSRPLIHLLYLSRVGR